MDFGAEQFQRSENVSRETIERLQLYASLLEAWNPSSKLVSGSTLADVWFRHFLDSSQLSRHLPECASLCADLGSGGGFPGMVLAILAAERRPDLRFALIEANLRKCEFLKQVSMQTGVPVEVLRDRAESCHPQEADIVVARGLAPLTRLVGLAERHLRTGGVCIFPKGASHESEVLDAKSRWEFTIDRVQSVTRKTSALLILRDIRHVASG